MVKDFVFILSMFMKILLLFIIGFILGCGYWDKHSITIMDYDNERIAAPDFCGNTDCKRLVDDFLRDRKNQK